MFTVKFYETKTGESDVWNFLEELRLRSHSNKDARIQYNQLLFYIDLLSKNGTFLPSTITKHIDEDTAPRQQPRTLLLLRQRRFRTASPFPKENNEDATP